MTSLLIADDQALVRVGLRKILEDEPDMTVAGEAEDGEEAVARARRLRPDLVLMDIRMPVLDGIEATRRIVRAQPATRVLILTTFGLDGYVYDALRAGASGFMLKDARPRKSPPPSASSPAARRCSPRPSPAPSSRSSPATTRHSTPTDPRRRGTDTTRTRGPRPPRPRTLQPRNLRPTRHQRSNHKNARRPHPSKTRPPRPRPSSHLRLRNRTHRTRIRPLTTGAAVPESPSNPGRLNQGRRRCAGANRGGRTSRLPCRAARTPLGGSPAQQSDRRGT